MPAKCCWSAISCFFLGWQLVGRSKLLHIILLVFFGGSEIQICRRCIWMQWMVKQSLEEFLLLATKQLLPCHN